MVKVLLVGVWACIVTLAASYGMIVWQADAPVEAKADEFFGGLDYVKTTPISVPMVSAGEVKGYVIAQFVFTVDGTILRKLSVPPDVFINDDAYRAIYARGNEIDFKNLDKFNVDELTKTIAVKVNERFKSDLVKDVLVEQFNYLSKDEVRAKTLNVVKTN
ncbi:hypothetical protein BH10PSE7_BH10PSE7_31050 [soil metagenome]